MQFFCVLAVFFLSNLNSYTFSAFFLSAAISIKASAIFYIPAFLGTIQYRYGIIKLIFCIAIIVSL